ncbi:MAG TPA: phosphatase PAP2 family protein [Candidatus Nanoarchaeia archaeon]|nr:phosphatase PAP2 family protein [Candidatus Nanoarchaeia archaeon]
MRKKESLVFLLAGVVLFYISTFFDKAASLMIDNIKIPFLDFVLSIITNFGVVVMAMLAIPLIIFYNKDKKIIKLLFSAFITSFIFSLILKLVISRQRPAGVLYYPLLNIIDYSFPSMHAMIVFSLLPILLLYLPKQKTFWVSFAFLVAFSRIYFDFHYLSDVVFGAVIGFFIGNFLLEFYYKNKSFKNAK